MTRILWFNPAVGVSGDMMLGTLVDAGADETRVRKALESLDVEGWNLDFSETIRRGLSCRIARVTTLTSSHPRGWSEIDTLIAQSSIPAFVSDGARATFLRLGEAEASRHGVPLEDVHFHEVGAVDAIVDIVGSWAALDSLNVDKVRSAPVGLGAGTVEAGHGVLPNPAPAVVSLLDGLPVRGVDTGAETATPTGVALLACMVDEWAPVPDGVLVSSGMGAGGRDLDSHPNVLSALIVEGDTPVRVDAILIETTVDDVTPEILGHVIDAAIDAGADDAWLSPVVMKKSRPGHEIRVLCAPGLERAIINLLATETGTLGVRSHRVDKTVYARSFTEVQVDGQPVSMKIGPFGAKPESADVMRVAQATGRSARAIAAEALSAWMSTEGD